MLIWRKYQQLLPTGTLVQVFEYYLEDRGTMDLADASIFENRQQPLDLLRPVAAKKCDAQKVFFPGKWWS
ncbi:MAG: hypothetical protein IPL65_19265 [Lewinellaceae bacterium]|nr:hypothetical protein [Lewinellaceae bacterium]